METEGSEDPALAIAARHALHDEELIAAFATDTDTVDDADRARSLIERCVACRDLHADLVAIGGVLRASDKAATVAATQPAPRDFRLSIETANRLRPGSVVLRSRDRLAAAIASLSRPVGVSMASLGVVGLLVGTLTMGVSVSLPSTAEDNGGTGRTSATSATSETGGAAGASALPGEVTGPLGTSLETTRMSFDALATPSATEAPTVPPTEAPIPAQGPLSSGPTMPTLIVGGSVILLTGGVLLLMLGSRRREPIPGR
jgi:hypothetical protein